MAKTGSLAAETDRIIQLLRQKYSDTRQWAFFTELRCGTGFVRYKGGGNSMQRLDFFVMNLYPSNNFRSIAFEIKVSRSDFLNEIKSPEKRAFAESVARECYFIVPNNLVEKDEIPEGWGLMYAQSNRIIRKKYATQRENTDFPMAFVAAIARRSQESAPKPFTARYQGKELTDEDLLELAKQTLHRSYDRRKNEIEQKAVREYKQKEEYQRILEVYNAVREITGLGWYIDTKMLHKWLREKRFSDQLEKTLIKTRNYINRLLDLADVE